MVIETYNLRKRQQRFEAARRTLESAQLTAVRELVPDGTITTLCEECTYYFRSRVLTPLVTIFHMVMAALSPSGSFQSAWQSVGETGKSDALAKARKRLPLTVWERLSQWVAHQTGREFHKDTQWWGHRVIGVDGTCVSMSDEAELEQTFGTCGSRQGRSRFPIGRVVFAVALNTMITIGHRMSTYRTSENALLAELFDHLGAGDLIVADRRFAGAALYVEYERRGLEFITKAHQRLRVEALRKAECFDNDDFIVELPVQSRYLRKDPSLPQSIEVRVIKTTATIRGRRESFWIVTSLMDAVRYPAEEIRLLYKKRWKIEGLIEEIKIRLGADVLRSKTVEGIYKEMYVRVIACNLIHWLILKAAKEHKVESGRVSFTAAVRLAASYSLKMSAAPLGLVPLLYRELLQKIACSRVAYRPGRVEPRLKRRDQKHYGILKTSRAEWRAAHALAA